MKKLLAMVTLSAATMGTGALSGAPTTGADAPDFGSPTWALNAPEVFNVSELKGEVIFIELWGTR